MNDYKQTLQHLRVREVAALTGMGVSTIWAKCKAGEFPKPIKLSTRLTCWKASEVQAWLESKGGQQNG